MPTLTSTSTQARTGQYDRYGNPIYNYSASQSGNPLDPVHDWFAQTQQQHQQILADQRAAYEAAQARQQQEAILNARAALQSSGYSGDVSGYGAPQLQQLQQSWQSQQAKAAQEAAQAKAINDYWQAQAYKYNVPGLPVSSTPNADVYKSYLDSAIQQQREQERAQQLAAQALAQGYQLDPAAARYMDQGVYNQFIGNRQNQNMQYANVYGIGGDVPAYMQGVYYAPAVNSYAGQAIPLQQATNQYTAQNRQLGLTSQGLQNQSLTQQMQLNANQDARAAAQLKIQQDAAAREQQQFVQGNTKEIDAVNARYAQSGRLGSAEHLADLTKLGAANYGTFNR